MENSEQIENIFQTTSRDAFSWVNQAEKHRIVSEIIHKELTNLIDNHPDIPDEMTRKALALFESYMLLCGLAFENLIKGLIISIKPNYKDEKELNIYKWNSNGGHGIKEMFIYNYPILNSSEKELIERIEEFLIWSGKYEIPLKLDKFVKSRFPRNKQTFYSTDNTIVENLFEKVKIQIEVNWEQNERLFWSWKEDQKKVIK